MNSCLEVQDKIEEGGYDLQWLKFHQRTCKRCQASEGNIAPHIDDMYNPPPFPELDDFPYQNQTNGVVKND